MVDSRLMGKEVQEVKAQYGQRTSALQLAKIVGNQKVVQRMWDGEDLGPREHRSPPRFPGMIYGTDAVSAIDAIVGPEIPDWMRGYRPSYAAGQVMAVWNASNPADNEDGTETADCVGGLDGKVTWNTSASRVDVWDMGHKPGCEFAKLQRKAMEGGLDQDEFLREFRDPSNYQVEDPSHNRSHIGEK